MTEFENEMLLRLLKMKTNELKEKGEKDLAEETEKLDYTLTAYKIMSKTKRIIE